MHVEDVVPVVKMFACFYSATTFYILSVVVESYRKRGLLLSDVLHFAEHTFYEVNNIVTFNRNFVIYMRLLFCEAFKCCCWNYLLAWEAS